MELWEQREGGGRRLQKACMYGTLGHLFAFMAVEIVPDQLRSRN